MTTERRPIPESASVIVNGLIDTARGFVEAGKELAPVAFFGMPDGNIAILPMEIPDGKSNDFAAKVIAEFAEQANATFILMIMEAWMVKIKDTAEARGITSLSNHPDRIDCISILFENQDGAWDDHIPVEFREGGTRTFRAVDFRMSDQLEGRFTGLFKAPAGKAN